MLSLPEKHALLLAPFHNAQPKNIIAAATVKREGRTAVCAGGSRGDASLPGRLGPRQRDVLPWATPGSPPTENRCAAQPEVMDRQGAPSGKLPPYRCLSAAPSWQCRDLHHSSPSLFPMALILLVKFLCQEQEKVNNVGKSRGADHFSRVRYLNELKNSGSFTPQTHHHHHQVMHF